MNRLEQLLKNYTGQVSVPWPSNLAGAQKVWFVVYEPEDERRLRLRIDEFQIRTLKAGHGWSSVDLTDAFATWMAAHDYRESYFGTPDHLRLALGTFRDFVAARIRAVLEESDANDVVAVTGVASLFSFLKVSELMKHVEGAVRGRLVVFFPGEYGDGNYRFLDARDGPNYLAVPITAAEGLYGA